MTEFALDSVFGYESSNLRDWVQEKTSGRVSPEDMVSISIEDIRLGGPKQITEKLMSLTDSQVCIVNAASYRDLEVFVQGLLYAEANGKQFLYRTGASFVRVRSGLTSKTLLKGIDLNMPKAGGGLIVVGSYVPRTTAQLEELLGLPGISGIEIRVEDILNENRCHREFQRVGLWAEKALETDNDVVIYTSRRIFSADTAEGNLQIGQCVSKGLIKTLQSVKIQPRYLIAKGGITASDLATEGLSVKRAMVLGQILPGVPVWQLGLESRHPGMSYIVFPGNVGSSSALVDVVTRLKSHE
jgi:uncharacterized protein YgbK (DUF1537 family)